MHKHEWNVPAIGLLALLGLWSAVGGVVLLTTMFVTTPAAVGPVGVTIWFILLFSFISSASTLLLYFIKLYFKLHATKQQRLRYAWRQGLLLSGWVAGLLALSSLGQLGLRDAILLGLATIIVELYVRFRWP
jgi:hypothetical protein